MQRRIITSAATTVAVISAFTVSTASAGHSPEAGSGGPVMAELETRATFDDEAGGFADTDDPGIWIHPDDEEDSIIVATEKENGLAVYDLDGDLLQEIPAPPPPGAGDEPGRLNNVDIAYDVPLGERGKVDLAIVSDRGLDQIRAYAIDADAAGDGDPPLTDVSAAELPFVFAANQDEVNSGNTSYGLGVWQHDGETFAFVSKNNDTVIAQARLRTTAAGRVTYDVIDTIELPAEFKLPDGSTWRPCNDPGELSHVEGIVIDRHRGVLYAGQEGVGIWKVAVSPAAGEPVLMDRVREYGVPWSYDPNADEECEVHYDQDPGYGGEHLTTDVEGVTLYYSGTWGGYLIASSQGSDSYVVYDRRGSNPVIGSFEITAGDVDGVSGTDGLDVTNVDLDGPFDDGLLVVQDDPNTPDVPDGNGEVRDNTNLKFVSWSDVAASFDPELAVNPDGHDPRARSRWSKH